MNPNNNNNTPLKTAGQKQGTPIQDNRQLAFTLRMRNGRLNRLMCPFDGCLTGPIGTLFITVTLINSFLITFINRWFYGTNLGTSAPSQTTPRPVQCPHRILRLF